MDSKLFSKIVNILPNSFKARCSPLCVSDSSLMVSDGIIMVKYCTEELKDIQLFLSGHMHAGCTPIWLRQVLNHIKILHSRGLVGPYFTLGSKDAYGLILYDMIAAIISGGVTKFAVSSEAKGIGTKLNKVFVPETEIIDIIPGEDLQFIQESRKKMAA